MSRDAAELRRDILAGPGADAEALIRDLAAHGTPLLTDDPADPGAQRVLLAYVAPPGSTGVYAWANRLTDGPHEERGQLRRWGSTDLWFTELVVPRGTIATYRFYPYTADDENLRDGQLRYSRAVATAAVSDPTNPAADSPFGSLLQTGGAPDLSRWSTGAPPEPAATGTLGTGAEQVRWRLLAPNPERAGKPARIVVLFDAQKWFDDYGLPAVLADAPIALLGVDAPHDAAARLRLLGPNRDFLKTVIDEALGEARRTLGTDSADTIWAGQSLGAASALAAARWFPGQVDGVLAYSPSMWWKPGITARPRQRPAERSWLAQTLADAQPCPVRLAVGSNEGLLVGSVTDLADELTAAGWSASLRVFDGGHDIAWWAHLLSSDITAPDLAEPQDRRGITSWEGKQ